mmetsp:Transcript_20220/g.38134  ORF Transcript_20220/g.38134 Transcript_20220/m.38134 type:complete len:93 (-) Transcript_20220:712-990(-)
METRVALLDNHTSITTIIHTNPLMKGGANLIQCTTVAPKKHANQVSSTRQCTTSPRQDNTRTDDASFQQTGTIKPPILRRETEVAYHNNLNK